MNWLRVPYARCRHSPKAPVGSPLQVNELSYSYPGHAKLALDHVSLEVCPGLSTALLGPNGSGKSTLLKAIAGIVPADPGRIEIFGGPLATCHHWVSYLPQRGELNWDFPILVKDLVLAGRYVHQGWFRRTTPEDRDRVQHALSQFQLTDLAERPIGQLSGGQQQRALLARALVQEAPLILLDEPLNAVDQETREVIYQALAKFRESGQSFVMATHDFRRVTELFDQVIFLDQGRIVPTPPEIRAEIEPIGSPSNHERKAST